MSRPQVDGCLITDDPEYADHCREAYITEMESKGYTIVYPTPYELLIDMDTEEQFKLFQQQYVRLVRDYGSEIMMRVYPSRHGLPGRHAIVTMPFEVSDIERIAFQAALGSDPIRELLSLGRVRCGDVHPTLFVEKPEALQQMVVPKQDKPERLYKIGDRVEKIKGSEWHGTVVGFYSTALTPIGYAVESDREKGSVQIYPQKALRSAEEKKEDDRFEFD